MTRLERLRKEHGQVTPRLHPERDLQEACEGLLMLDGWRVFRLEQNYSERKRKVVGEAGGPDGLYIRYHPDDPGVLNAVVLWIEWKSPKGKPSPLQRLWIAAERARGALVWLAGTDFPASIQGFLEHYRGSSLMRKQL